MELGYEEGLTNEYYAGDQTEKIKPKVGKRDHTTAANKRMKEKMIKLNLKPYTYSCEEEL